MLKMKQTPQYINLNKNKQMKFGNQSPIISKDTQNYSNLTVLKEELNKIIAKIGGIEIRSDFDGDILIAKEKIKMLKSQTNKAYENAPKILQQRTAELNFYDKRLSALQKSATSTFKAVENEKSELILPDEKTNEKKELITNSLEALAAYNSISKNKSQRPENFSAEQKLISMAEISSSIDDTKEKTFDWKNFNKKDALFYSKLKNQLIFTDEKDLISNQIEFLTKKISELKQNESKTSLKTGLNVYLPESTGKIMTLDAAKLRRENLLNTIINPITDENLSKPNIISQSIKGQATQFFEIDEANSPDNNQIKEILALNSNYKPIINQLFEKGLDLYIVPGHSAKEFGAMEGGLCLPDNPDAGIWLEAYDVENRYAHMATKEKALAHLNEAENFKPSALPDNKDRARALAHELGHVISFKLMDKKKDDNKINSILSLDSSSGIDFMQGWKTLRIGCKLNDDRIIRNERKYMDEESIENINSIVDYEMVAEDIRTAITGEEIPASSKMTGIYDSSKEGKKQLTSVENFIQSCLLDNKTPSTSLFENIVQ